MSIYRAMASGLIGACALTLIHQSARQITPNAPRLDVLGMRAVRQSLTNLDQPAPTGTTLYRTTLAGDLVSNAFYYSLVGAGQPDSAVWRGALLGGLAGIGSVVLPGPLGLGQAATARTNATAAMAVAWYTIGGIVAALAYRILAPKQRW